MAMLTMLTAALLIPAMAGAADQSNTLTNAVNTSSTSSNPRSAGTIEFAPSVSFSRSAFTPVGGTTSIATTNLSASAAIGRCMTDRVELIGTLLLQHRDEAGSGRTGYGGGAGVQYNLIPQNNVTPFFSATVGAISYSGTAGSDKAFLAPMLRAGVSTSIMEGRAVNISAGYQHEINRKSTLEKSADAFDVAIGMSFFRPQGQ